MACLRSHEVAHMRARYCARSMNRFGPHDCGYSLYVRFRLHLRYICANHDRGTRCSSLVSTISLYPQTHVSARAAGYLCSPVNHHFVHRTMIQNSRLRSPSPWTRSSSLVHAAQSINISARPARSSRSFSMPRTLPCRQRYINLTQSWGFSSVGLLLSTLPRLGAITNPQAPPTIAIDCAHTYHHPHPRPQLLLPHRPLLPSPP